MPVDVPIRPASTVIVLRDGPAGPEVFMVRRTFTIAFMAGAHVFPGGRVDAADADVDAAWCDLPTADVGSSRPDLSFAVAATRELFEESGVLLARGADGAFIDLADDDVRARFDRYRDEIHDGTTTLRAVLEAGSLRLALDAVIPFARWVTPPTEARRFDTWFFVARMPDGQRPVHDPHESIDSAWLTPGDALARARSGTMHLPPPTWATLRELEPFATVDAAIGWARRRAIVPRHPLVVASNGAREILLPGAPGHPDQEDVTYETRFVWAGDRWLPHAGRP
ncbi:MAG TPA: NUDIX domain-containing protein [Vicinamibacterales bacterium]|nr:NUDIX domain-containing protein [Vicinamibacterales bacterium]